MSVLLEPIRTFKSIRADIARDAHVMSDPQRGGAAAAGPPGQTTGGHSPSGRTGAAAPENPTPSVSESVALVLRAVDEFLEFMDPIAQLDDERLAAVAGYLSGAVPPLLNGVRDMLSVAVQVEEPAWAAPLADAIAQLELAFSRLGASGHLSRTSPPPVVLPMGHDVRAWRVLSERQHSPSHIVPGEASALSHGDPHNLIHFIAWLGGSGLSRIRLIKFIYLADVHEFQRSRRRATPYRWRFYHYGPWTLEAQRDIDVCADTGLLVTTPYAREGEADEILLYRARIAPSGLNAPYSASLEMILRHEVARWAHQPLNMFLNYVYFDTPPMREAQRGDYLRFDSETFGSLDVMEQTAPPRKRYTTRLARAAFERLRNETPTDSVRVPRDAIIDEDYDRAVSALDRQDEIGDLRGGILIEPDKLDPDSSRVRKNGLMQTISSSR